MVRSLWFLVQLTVLAYAVAWVARNPGFVRIEWLSYALTVQIGLVFLVLLAVLACVLVLHRAYLAILAWPERMKARQRERGLTALTLGMAALSAGDAKQARVQARKARRALPDRRGGLPLFLLAQAERMEGKMDKALRHFEVVMQDEEAAFLGLKGSLQARLETVDGADSVQEAQDLVRQALQTHPKNPWLLQMAYRLAVRRKAWGEALKALEVLARHGGGAVKPEVLRRDKVAVMVAQADDLRGAEALSVLEKAYRIDSAFVPLIVRMVEAIVAAGQVRKAEGRLKKAWKAEAHPDLARVWGAVMPQGKSVKPMARVRWYEKLIAMQPAAAESYRAVSAVALEENLKGEAQRYLSRAEELSAGAEGEAAWVCRETGRVYEQWEAFAAPHMAFNTMEWRVPSGFVSGGEREGLLQGF